MLLIVLIYYYRQWKLKWVNKLNSMATSSEIMFYGGYLSLHNFHLVLTRPTYWRSKKGKGTKELEQSERFSTNIQEVTSNVAITEKNEKQNVRLPLSKPRTQGAFSDKVSVILLVLLMSQ